MKQKSAISSCFWTKIWDPKWLSDTQKKENQESSSKMESLFIECPETHGQARTHLHCFKPGGEHNRRNRRWVEGTALCSLGDRMVSKGAAHGRLGCGSRSARSAQHVRIARHNTISLMVEWELGCGSRGTRSAWHVRIVGHNMISLMVECDLGFGSRSTTHSM